MANALATTRESRNTDTAETKPRQPITAGKPCANAALIPRRTPQNAITEEELRSASVGISLKISSPIWANDHSTKLSTASTMTGITNPPIVDGLPDQNRPTTAENTIHRKPSSRIRKTLYVYACCNRRRTRSRRSNSLGPTVVTTGGGAPLQGGPPPPYALLKLPTTFAQVFRFWNDLQIPRHMQSARVLPIKRPDMVNNMFDPG